MAPPPDRIPLVTFVNSRSGGQQGIKILEKIKKYVPQDHIFDISQAGPSPGLLKYKGTRFRILVCGGDGTVGWVLSEIEKQKFPVELIPPIAILPIGTGNDLSRTLRWGGGYSGRGLRAHIKQVEKACVVMMDKWSVVAEPLNANPPSASAQALPPVPPFMNNYFSVGSDAEIALLFHEMRTAHPERFTSRVQNLAWYVRLGLAHKPESVRASIEVVVDGNAVHVPKKARTVVVLNLPSYAGGSNPWGAYKNSHKKKNLVNPMIDDGLFEVVAINGPMQIAAIHANVARGKKLGQGREVKITLKKAIAAQVDGEPWKQPPSVITIRHAGTSVMLANSPANAPHLPYHEHVPAAVRDPVTHSPQRSPSMYTNLLVRKASDSAVFASQQTPRAAALQRTRTACAPIVHMASPLKYGPIEPSKRKKGRIYCDGCGIEFFLPHLLSNHLKSGLCPSGPSSSPAGESSSGKGRTQSVNNKNKEEEQDGAGSGKGKEKVKEEQEKEEEKDGKEKDNVKEKEEVRNVEKEEDGAGREPKVEEPKIVEEKIKEEETKVEEQTKIAEPTKIEEQTKVEEATKEKEEHKTEEKPTSSKEETPDEAAANPHVSSSPPPSESLSSSSLSSPSSPSLPLLPTPHDNPLPQNE